MTSGHDCPRALSLTVVPHHGSCVDAKVTHRLSRSPHCDDLVLDNLPAGRTHDGHLVRSKELGASFGVEVEDLCQRLGWNDFERPIQQLLQAWTEHRQPSGSVQDGDSKARATQERAKSGGVDRGDRAGRVLLGRGHTVPYLRRRLGLTSP